MSFDNPVALSALATVANQSDFMVNSAIAPAIVHNATRVVSEVRVTRRNVNQYRRSLHAWFPKAGEPWDQSRNVGNLSREFREFTIVLASALRGRVRVLRLSEKTNCTWLEPIADDLFTQTTSASIALRVAIEDVLL